MVERKIRRELSRFSNHEGHELEVWFESDVSEWVCVAIGRDIKVREASKAMALERCRMALDEELG